jgi:hypothetical protein
VNWFTLAKKSIQSGTSPASYTWPALMEQFDPCASIGTGVSQSRSRSGHPGPVLRRRLHFSVWNTRRAAAQRNDAASRTHECWIDANLSKEAQEPQFSTVKINLQDRQDQKEGDRNEQKNWRGLGRAILRRPLNRGVPAKRDEPSVQLRKVMSLHCNTTRFDTRRETSALRRLSIPIIANTTPIAERTKASSFGFGGLLPQQVRMLVENDLPESRRPFSCSKRAVQHRRGSATLTASILIRALLNPGVKCRLYRRPANQPVTPIISLRANHQHPALTVRILV